MTTINDVINYVFYTMENTNPAILRQFLEELVEDSQFEPIIVEPSIAENAGEDATIFADSVYNKKGSNQTLNRENDEDVAANYYVKIADVNGDVSFKIDNELITKEDILKLSIGNNSFVVDNYYYVEDGELYAAFPILLFEDIVVNGTRVTPNKTVEKLKVTGVRFVGTGEIIDNGYNNFIVNVEERNGYIDFGLENVEQNATILTKKVTNDTTTTYGFVKADEKIGDSWGIGYMPFAWSTTDEAWKKQDDRVVIDYTVFSPVLNKQNTILLDCRKGSAIDDEDIIIYDGGGVAG